MLLALVGMGYSKPERSLATDLEAGHGGVPARVLLGVLGGHTSRRTVGATACIHHRQGGGEPACLKGREEKGEGGASKGSDLPEDDGHSDVTGRHVQLLGGRVDHLN